MDVSNGKKIYEGKFSIVFLLEHKGQKFIIKQLHPRHCNNSVEVKKFKKEAIFPTIEGVMPKVLDYKESAGNYFIVKEFIEGFTLDKLHRKNRGKRFHPLYKNIYVDLCNKLQVLHNHGIIHGDVKPSNIMIADVESGKDVWLLDAGLAYKKNELPEKNEQIPLPFSMLYSAPELMLNEPEFITPLTDLLSVGICMYESFSGNVPYEANHPAILLQMMLAVPLKRKWRMNKELFNIISNLTAKPLFKKPVAHYTINEVKNILKLNQTERWVIPTADELKNKLLFIS